MGQGTQLAQASADMVLLAEPLRIGIGIHIGPVIVGEMGYSRATSVTAIGDAVATAAVLTKMLDAASIEVSRRARRAKTDRLDAQALLEKLMRYAHGERRVWRL